MTHTPPVGTVMKDTARDKFGEFRERLGGRVYLRPVGGGREWAASPDVVRQATYAETKRVRGSR
ncbi:hypothetical protein [Streptomyces sp. NPDC051677]|uniref:hypothetical protein n=1 Tax=Streptomyces sp. NPDC051677 TaxID=3365669 RepID=UPI0037CF828E